MLSCARGSAVCVPVCAGAVDAESTRLKLRLLTRRYFILFLFLGVFLWKRVISVQVSHFLASTCLLQCDNGNDDERLQKFASVRGAHIDE